jgi:hypothetical protein
VGLYLHIPYVFKFCCLTKHSGSSIEICILCLQHAEGDAVLQVVLKFEITNDAPFIVAVKILYHHHHILIINNVFGWYLYLKL